MTKSLGALLFVLVLFPGYGFSQDISATTEDGRKVLLKKDGTWKFYDAPKPAAARAIGPYQKSKDSTSVFKARGDTFQIWFNPLKWRQKRTADSDKPKFEHKDGDVYAMILAERFAMAPDALKELAVRNALNAAPDARVTREENREVNGKKVLCMRMEGTIEGVQFVYYGYYYAGKGGIVQLITFTSRNLYAEYEKEMTEFLNGLVIND